MTAVILGRRSLVKTLVSPSALLGRQNLKTLLLITVLVMLRVLGLIGVLREMNLLNRWSSVILPLRMVNRRPKRLAQVLPLFGMDRYLILVWITVLLIMLCSAGQLCGKLLMVCRQVSLCSVIVLSPDSRGTWAVLVLRVVDVGPVVTCIPSLCKCPCCVPCPTRLRVRSWLKRPPVRWNNDRVSTRVRGASLLRDVAMSITPSLGRRTQLSVRNRCPAPL